MRYILSLFIILFFSACQDMQRGNSNGVQVYGQNKNFLNYTSRAEQKIKAKELELAKKLEIKTVLLQHGAMLTNSLAINFNKIIGGVLPIKSSNFFVWGKNLEDYSKAVYLIRIKTANEIINKKLILR